MSQRVIIFGKKFADIRRQRYLTQEEFAQKLQMSPANVRRLEQSETSGMQVKNFRRLATLLDIGPDELRARIGVPAGVHLLRESPDQPAPVTPDPKFPSAIVPGSMKEVVDVEAYHSVSAARKEDRTATRRGTTAVPAGSPRRFSVKVDGDCMEPKYRDGETVLFSVDAAEAEGIVDGRNYFLQFADGENTFKRVFLDPENRELLVLKCWNERYPPRVIERSSVKLLARATGKFTPDEMV